MREIGVPKSSKKERAGKGREKEKQKGGYTIDEVPQEFSGCRLPFPSQLRRRKANYSQRGRDQAFEMTQTTGAGASGRGD